MFVTPLLKFIYEAPKSSYSEFLGPYVAVGFFWGQSCLCLKPKCVCIYIYKEKEKEGKKEKKKVDIYPITGHEGPKGE